MRSRHIRRSDKDTAEEISYPRQADKRCLPNAAESVHCHAETKDCQKIFDGIAAYQVSEPLDPEANLFQLPFF